MGKHTITPTTPETSTTRWSSWHDVVTARHEFQQARLRVAIEDDGDTEEYL
ncbi:hypothetical protein M3148_01015 [Georgenia satyanarayanai]|uniref:hypothetical protein n=1 Tax=Georgenia satyanarayanai TaxID=860221 RepID=UPI00203ABCE2|nr:hypothetical protein [Georgenia satyanarayanai]MCM3659577.1 hypothetical protein [Georgenia satyanarayanai]